MKRMEGQQSIVHTGECIYSLTMIYYRTIHNKIFLGDRATHSMEVQVKSAYFDQNGKEIQAGEINWEKFT